MKNYLSTLGYNLEFRKIFLFVCLSFIVMILSGQEITGQWNGILNAGAIQLRIVFHISGSDNGYSATMDSPDQKASGIPVTSVSFEKPVLRILLQNLRAEYTGEWKDTVITGTFKQAGMSFPLDLSRKSPEKKVAKRPQEPKEPFPYLVENVVIENSKDQVKLAGTLTLPSGEGRFPAVILISGSGPQDRNEEIFGHKPFLVLSDHLTRNGIAVLRFDDRGTHQSTGNYASATSRDFAADVTAAFNYLLSRKEIDKKKTGLIGHSEGGIIAPMVAAGNKKVAFIILLAGTSIRGDRLLLMQQELISTAMGIDKEQMKRNQAINRGAYDLIQTISDPDSLKKELDGYFRQEFRKVPASDRPQGTSEEDFTTALKSQLFNPWMLNFLRYDPAPTLEKVKCPLLALNGEKDLQVPAGINLEGIRKSLAKGGNKKGTIREIPGVNHLFQHSKSGLPSEYGEIEETFSPEVLDLISSWIKEVNGKR